MHRVTGIRKINLYLKADSDMIIVDKKKFLPSKYMKQIVFLRCAKGEYANLRIDSELSNTIEKNDVNLQEMR